MQGWDLTPFAPSPRLLVGSLTWREDSRCLRASYPNLLLHRDISSSSGLTLRSQHGSLWAAVVVVRIVTTLVSRGLPRRQYTTTQANLASDRGAELAMCQRGYRHASTPANSRHTGGVRITLAHGRLWTWLSCCEHTSASAASGMVLVPG